MIEQPSPVTDPAHTEAEQRTFVAPSPNGHRPLIEVCLPEALAGNDTSLSADPSADLCVQLDRAGQRITVHGDLDLAVVPVLADVMAMLIGLDPGDTAIDLASVSFIDAAGLGCLVGFANQLAEHGAKLAVVGASPRLRRVFDLVQLGGLLQES